MASPKPRSTARIWISRPRHFAARALFQLENHFRTPTPTCSINICSRALSAFPACCTSGERAPGDVGLVAYVVAAPGQAMDIGLLRTFLKGKLPAYMLPSAFEVLEKIPLNANRKVDRKALPAPKQKSADVVEAFVAPRSEN